MNIVSTIAAAIITLGAVATTAEAEHVQRSLIISGDEVPVGSKLYAVSIRHSADGNSLCAGTLIAPNLVLTSGWCGSLHPEYVAVGTRYINGTQDGEQIKVKSVVMHPDPSNSVNPPYDFAALVLESPSKYPYAALPAADAPVEPSTQAKAMGWGFKAIPEESLPDVLRFIEVEVQDNSACSTFVHSTDVCALTAPGKGICFGDMGAPLIVEGNDGDSSDTLIGVTALGQDCRVGDFSLFYRVSVVVDWILSITLPTN